MGIGRILSSEVLADPEGFSIRLQRPNKVALSLQRVSDAVMGGREAPLPA